jgi:glycerol kinase
LAHDRILAIDQGTTGTRAIVVDHDARVLAHAYRAHAQHHPRPGWVEHDAREIWEAALDVALRALRASGSEGRIGGIAIANQGETVVAWDRATGEPIHRAIVWQDTRTQSGMDALAADGAFADQVARRTGLRIDPYFAASKIRWLLDHADGAADLAKSGRLCVATLDAWLIFKLTGGASYVTDPSTASRTLLYDVHRLAWDDELCARFGVPRAVLPEVRPTTGEFGRVAGLGAALDGAPIVASLVDQPAALFGHGCIDAGGTKATYGTGCFVYVNTGATPRASSHELLTTLVWQRPGEAADARATYALEGGVLAAGSVVTWMRDGLGLAASDADVDALANSVDDTGGVTCVPAFAGLGAPYWDRSARAAWLGMTLGTTRAHLARAALLGVACRVAQIVRAMERDAGARIAELRVDGGVTASKTLMQMQADLLGTPIAVAKEADATSLGAAFLAARSLGVWASDAEVLRHVHTASVISPRASADWRESTLDAFERAVRAATGRA